MREGKRGFLLGFVAGVVSTGAALFAAVALGGGLDRLVWREPPAAETAAPAPAVQAPEDAEAQARAYCGRLAPESFAAQEVCIRDEMRAYRELHR
jgi:hypothetical protein